jgi:non-ribosomal peptide synthetase component F
VPQVHSEWAAAERAFWTPDELARRSGFWKAQLDGSQPVWARHEHTARGPGPLQRWICTFPAAPTRALREVAARHGATLFSTLLAGFRLALWKWAGCEDLVVGTPVANRNRESVRQTMGYFAGIVPLRGQVEAARTFATHLRATHAATVDSFANALPFAEIAQLLGASSAPGRHSLFDVRFALQNHPVPDVDLPRISTRLHMRSTGTARFDLGCEITESGDELEVVWLYRPSMFSASDLSDLDRLFRAVLERIGRNPEERSDAIVP